MSENHKNAENIRRREDVCEIESKHCSCVVDNKTRRPGGGESPLVMSSIVLFRPISILSTEFRHLISLSTSSLHKCDLGHLCQCKQDFKNIIYTLIWARCPYLHASWITLDKDFVSASKISKKLWQRLCHINHICKCKQDFKILLHITLHYISVKGRLNNIWKMHNWQMMASLKGDDGHLPV